MTRIFDKLLRAAGYVTAAALMATAAYSPALAANSASIVMYHRFGEGDFPSTNIRLDQFESHIAELVFGDYTVLPVPDILAALREGRPLPERTVGITIDDAYLSVYTEAWPRLRRAGFPFTLFIATDAIDKEFSRYMSWDQIRELRDAGVTIGSQTGSHLHMAASSAARNREDIERSNDRFRTELGAVPALFAYPYGEASLEVMQIVREAGFTDAFGQHSGGLGAATDRYYMPRFALNENFGDLDRFELVARARPIPHSDLTPADPLLLQNPPLFGFTVTNENVQLNGLACYSSGRGKLQLERLGPRIEVRLSAPFDPGRARINCTARDKDGAWRWLGMQYYVPKP